MRRASSAVAAVLCATALAACGDDASDEPQTPIGDEPGVGGTLTWAVADPVRSLDPLTAETRAEQLVARQVHEPLTAELSGPFGETGQVRALAPGVRASADSTVWTFKLRTGVRFRDGAAFNAGAVLANAARWQGSPVATALLPSFVVDAPRPDQVRFILAEPDPELDEKLAAPELGIVSPRALRRAGASGLRGRGTGTGPFELREAGAGRLLLAQNLQWWGRGAGLGPALDQLGFRSEPSDAIRLALLEAGAAQLADQLERERAEFARMDPLLTALPAGDGTFLAFERSVRGIDDAEEIPALSEAWLTYLGAE